MRCLLSTVLLVLALVAPADAVAMPGCAPGHAMAQAATRSAEPCPHCASSAPADDAQTEAQGEGEEKPGCGAASCCADPAAPPATPADGQLPLSAGVPAPAPSGRIAARNLPRRRPERARAPVCARSGTARSLNVLHCVWRL